MAIRDRPKKRGAEPDDVIAARRLVSSAEQTALDEANRLRRERDEAERRAGEQAARLAEEGLALMQSIHELSASVVEGARHEARRLRAEALARVEAEVERERQRRFAELDEELALRAA